MTTSPLSSAPANWLDSAQFGVTAQTQETKKVGEDPTATKEMFLQLLVAQMRNQNPLNPSDGTEYLAQLSEFTGVEQMLAMRQELTSIKDLLSAGLEG
jgi:flagellar basal-body rod modification protein FlgD